jgi:hypothetical protein
MCGKVLLTDYEIEGGCCVECLAKYEQNCANCDEPLLSDYEIEKGYCRDCLHLWSEYLPS